MVDVTDVPMLAPMIRGMAWFTSSNSAATIVITIEVEVDEDCTSTVTSTPTIMPAIGLLKTSELRKTSPAWRPASSRKPSARNERQQMNK